MYLSIFLIQDNYDKFKNITNVLVEDEIVSTVKIYSCCLIS